MACVFLRVCSGQELQSGPCLLKPQARWQLPQIGAAASLSKARSTSEALAKDDTRTWIVQMAVGSPCFSEPRRKRLMASSSYRLDAMGNASGSASVNRKGAARRLHGSLRGVREETGPESGGSTFSSHLGAYMHPDMHEQDCAREQIAVTASRETECERLSQASCGMHAPSSIASRGCGAVPNTRRGACRMQRSAVCLLSWRLRAPIKTDRRFGSRTCCRPRCAQFHHVRRRGQLELRADPAAFYGWKRRRALRLSEGSR